MKKLLFLALASVLVLTSVFVPGVWAEANLISNSSVETGNADGWQKNSWGTNTPTYSVKSGDAQDGSKSLYVNVSNYQSGDAKWYHPHVAITPGEKYVYSDYYKASVASNVTIEVITTSGAYEYYWLGSPAASSTYKKFEAAFTAPANAKSVAVYHLLNQNGWLQTDNFSLTLANPNPDPEPEPEPEPEPNPDPTPAPDNLVANGSIESGITGWNKDSWGTNQPSYSIETTGSHDGTNSLYLSVSNYQSGDAKWQFNHVAVKPSTEYVFSDYYKSSVASNITLEVITTAGAYQYYWLGSPAASSAYKKFEANFTTPANAKSVSVLHLLSGNGWLQTDAYSLSEANPAPDPQPQPDPAKFSRPLISIEFDDGWKNAYQNGFPIVESFGYRASQYVITGTTQWNGYMNDADIVDLKNRGHDIGSHTITHPHLPQLGNAQITNELSQSKQYLQNLLGTPVNTFVTPFCESNSTVSAIAKQYYASQRNCVHQPNTKANFDAYNIRAYIVLKDTTQAEIQSWIDRAKDENGWLVIVYHEIKQNPDNDWALAPDTLRSQLQMVKDSGITVKKTTDALAEIIPQL
jgi:peptidoglycan/xylan/chitin deacetylase (PgdA/CDA1 family)